MTTGNVARPKNGNPVYRLCDALLRRVLRTIPPSEFAEKCALWWGYRFRPAPRVSKLRSGPLIETNHTDHLQLLIYYLGTFEPHCLPYLRGCVAEGGTIIDVGANIGFYTLESAVLVGETGRVIAIEAAQSHVRTLNRNIELNAMQNVAVVETAVGNSRGQATLARSSEDNLGMFSLGSGGDVDAHLVAIRTIDELLEEQGTDGVDLIKMDIEGSEFNALQGAKMTLRKYQPAILIELNDTALRRCGSSSRDVVQLLHEMNYQGWRINRNSAELIIDGDDVGEFDECIFLSRDREVLAEKLGLKK
jgi:FkbM family methyltransferase